MNERAKGARAVREGGYELLLLLSGAAQGVGRSGVRGMGGAGEIMVADRRWRVEWRRLERKGYVGLVDSALGKVPRLTAAGRRALDGGRDPEAAWQRDWDGRWRILMFDLPREASQARVKFWRWLKGRHFGKLQGSAWITPDPIRDLATAAGESGIDPALLMVFAGSFEDRSEPREVASAAWDWTGLGQLNQAYRDFAKRGLHQLRERPQSAAFLSELVRTERRLWTAAIRHDPLLPKIALPADYGGVQTLALRRELHAVIAARVAESAPA